MQKIQYSNAITPLSIVLSAFFLTSCVTKQNNNRDQAAQVKTIIPIVMTAVTDFVNADGQDKTWYVDNDRRSLAVDAEFFKGQFAMVQSQFPYQSGQYQIELTALTETDGESQYQLTIGGQALPMVKNPESTVDFKPHVHQWNNIRVNADDTITVSFNSATNGKIPEGESTAYARGRWTKLELVCKADCK